jgi:hypothetical protein
VTFVVVRIVCRFQWEELILHLICGVPVPFSLDLRFICFVPSPDRLGCYVAQVADFPLGPAIAGLVFPSAGLSLVSALPDSLFSPARELSTRAAADFHFTLRSGSEVFVGFNLDFSDSFFSVSAQLQ